VLHVHISQNGLRRTIRPAREEHMKIPMGQLLPGDVLLHASKGEVSKLIQWASDSDYSHIAMVFDPGKLAEAASGGVRFDGDLKKRIEGVPNDFHRIDAWRPLPGGKPIEAAALQALKASANAMAGRPFALNQWFELGLICAIRNKAPETPFIKWFLALVIETFVKKDPSRLLCSEFIYLAFHHAATEPPGLLDPKITRPPRPNRPFPKDLNLIGLIKEYLDASGKRADLVDVLSLFDEFAQLRAGETEDLWSEARRSTLAVLKDTRANWSTIDGHATSAAAPSPHPDLIEPQDFAESPSFCELGTVVIV
jgi:hypothetical protein